MTRIEGNYPFKGWMTSQVDGFCQGAAVLSNLAEIEQGRDALDQDPVLCQERLERLLMLLRKVHKHVDEMRVETEKMNKTKETFDHLDKTGLNPLSYDLGNFLSSLCESEVITQLVRSLVSYYSLELQQHSKKLATLTQGLHKPDVSWKNGIADKADAQSIVKLALPVITSVANAESIEPCKEAFEKDRFGI